MVQLEKRAVCHSTDTGWVRPVIALLASVSQVSPALLKTVLQALHLLALLGRPG